jgi:hypothetical protein
MPRPTNVIAPSDISYGTAIPDIKIALATPQVYGTGPNASDAVDFVTLIRCGSVTHHFDAEQRCIRLDVTARSTHNKITGASLPAQPLGSRIAPPGYYMLFVVTKPVPQAPGQGRRLQVPSVATFVRIG